MSYRELAVAGIPGLPFVDFYEALRSAPGEAREKWTSELAAMPEGPQRTAAVSGFYKLLVQFDPAAAVKAIGEIEDVGLQRVALDSAVDAAPGFALPLMAELSLNLQERLTGKRDHLSDVVLEWMLIDAPATARFIDDHTEAFDILSSRGQERFLTTTQVVSAWATIDPKAAKEWLERTGKWDGWEIRKGFLEGWYENDRDAAVSFALANVEDSEMGPAIGGVVLSLYIDSREEAAKFIESLPADKRPEALSDAFHNLILGVEEDTGDTVLAQRAVASWMTEFPPAYWKGAVARLFALTEEGSDDMLFWIEQLPSALHEAVAAEYAPPFWKSTSETIMGVLQVADPTLRDQLLRATLKNQHSDFDEAKAAIANASLSSEQKHRLLQIVATAEAEKD